MSAQNVNRPHDVEGGAVPAWCRRAVDRDARRGQAGTGGTPRIAARVRLRSAGPPTRWWDEVQTCAIRPEERHGAIDVAPHLEQFAREALRSDDDRLVVLASVDGELEVLQWRLDEDGDPPSQLTLDDAPLDLFALSDSFVPDEPATCCALFAGIFIVRYHLELLLFAPMAAGMFAYYLHIGMLPDSPVQNPEKLYRQKTFFAYMLLSTVLFVVLMFTSIPGLYDLFNVEANRAEPLWTLGAPR